MASTNGRAGICHPSQSGETYDKGRLELAIRLNMQAADGEPPPCRGEELDLRM